MGQLADARARLAHATAAEEQARVKLGMATRDLAALEVRWKEVEKEVGEGRGALEKGKREVEEVRRRMDGCGWSEQREKVGEGALRDQKSTVRKLTEERDAIKQRLSALDFQYTPPSPTFPRTAVKGLVASLVTLNAEDYDKATALEVTAGAKLWNVVVEDERVGKELLVGGRLKKRVTIIPLSRISAGKMDAKV